MKTVCLLLFICLGYTTFAQEDSSQDWIKVLSYGASNQTDQKKISLEEAIQRQERCIPSSFSNANLILSNQALVENVIVKYDFKEQVLLVRQDDYVLVGAPNMVKRIQFENPQFGELINVQELGRSYGRRGFYSVLANSNNGYLVKYHSFEQKKIMPNSSVTTTNVYEPLEEEPEFFINEETLITKNEELFVLENFKPKTLSKFNTLSNSLKAYIKKEKLKFKNEDDLRKFATYLWSL
ncbi:hypothetical protein [Reichenbachiella sp.]|uniref:hypothetical protein n=1 Tax=Reichenbachiella sp. TaxID=2184521 RepID=UPI003BAEB821